MPSDRVNRHQAQREKIKVLREHRKESAQYRIQTIPSLTSTSNSTPADDTLEQMMRSQQQEIKDFNAPVTITVVEADALLTELRSKWTEQQTNQLLGNCRNTVLNSIAGPFGLGSIVAAIDKTGAMSLLPKMQNKVFFRGQKKSMSVMITPEMPTPKLVDNIRMRGLLKTLK